MFWGCILLLNLMIPISMLIIGMLHLMKPPKNRNWLYGYCTKRSTKSQETWEFAQGYFGRACCYRGVGSILLVLVIMLSVLKMNEQIIRTTGSVMGMLEAVLMIGAFVSTEYTLKKKYGL